MKKGIISLLLCAAVLVSTSVTAYAGNANLIGVTDDGHDHTSYYSDISSYLNKMGYSSSQIITRTDPTKTAAMNLLKTGDIFVSRSHGGAFQDSNGDYIGSFILLKSGGIYNSDIEELSNNALSNAKLIMYVGCHTAAGGVWDASQRNLVVVSTNKGAKVAVGFTESINCKGANTWTGYAFKHLSNGENVDRALNKAVADTKEKHWILEGAGSLKIDSMLYRGEWNLTFN